MTREKELDVAVVGNVGIDTNVYFPEGDVDFTAESNFTENIDYVGQAGGYTSRGFSRLGLRTAFVGYLGDDASGHLIREEFAGDGIDTTAVFIDPAGTSRSINFMYGDGRRKNFYDGKSHCALAPDLEVCRSILAKSTLAHFNIPDWARHLLPLAKELGLTISCDIQDVPLAGDAYRKDFVEYADVLFFSAVNHDRPGDLIEAFLQTKPNQIVVAGMRANGCAVGTASGLEFFPAVQLEAPVVDTNGAGDGLAVGFLSSYVFKGCSVHDAILRGQIVARHTCSQRASSSNLMTADQLEREIKSVPTKQVT